jgi:hypothetical protein
MEARKLKMEQAVYKWSQIRINLMRSRIRIRIRVKKPDPDKHSREKLDLEPHERYANPQPCKNLNTSATCVEICGWQTSNCSLLQILHSATS